MDWREEYQRKLMTPEEAAKLIKSGERLGIGGSTDQPKIMSDMIFARHDELEGVKVFIACPFNDPGWLQAGYEKSFDVTITGFVGPIARPSTDARVSDFVPVGWDFTLRDHEREGEHEDIDWFIVTVSPPNKHGYFNFGPCLWFKRSFANHSKRIIAEVDSTIGWYYGDTAIHISEIDHIVEFTPPIIAGDEIAKAVADIEPEGKRDKVADMLSQVWLYFRPMLLSLAKMVPDEAGVDNLLRMAGLVPPPEAPAIAGYLNMLMKDRDCFQIGQGVPSGFVTRLGAFEGKEDLGYHAEMTARGVGTMIKEGQITGKYKNFMPGKAVFSSLDGMDPEELDWASENPGIELYATEWTSSIPIVAMNDNQVSIQNGLSVDLTGQINSETTFGARVVNGTGGQFCSHVGALCSKGGRAITLMHSAILDDTVSCIVPQFEPGVVATVPRSCADYIVTEYGIAKLMAKGFRERANELIAIAHPDFRAELRKEAQKLFWP